MDSIAELKNNMKLAPSFEDAIKIVSDFITRNPDNDEAYTIRGMKYWGAGMRALAINDYLKAISINPDSKANMALKASNEILDYRNKDLYNP